MRIRFIDSSDGDWTALYVDGKKLDEGHSLDPKAVLELLGLEVLPTIERDVDPYAVDESFPSEIDMDTGEAI